MLARPANKDGNISALTISSAAIMVGALFETDFFVQYGYFPNPVSLVVTWFNYSPQGRNEIVITSKAKGGGRFVRVVSRVCPDLTTVPKGDQ